MTGKRKKRVSAFPMRLSKGGTTVRVTELGNGYYRVAYYLGGKRRTEDYKDKETAIQLANTKLANLQRGNIDAAQITDRDRQAYARALDAIAGLEVKLDAAAHQFAEAARMLDGVSVVEAAKFYLHHHSQTITIRTVQEVVDELVKDTERLKRGERRIRELRNVGNRFAKAHQLPINNLTSDMARDWLEANCIAERTYNNRAAIILRIVAFAKEKKYIAKDFEIEIARKTVVHGDPEIWTPKEMASLLAKAEPSAVPIIALGAFAGLRTAEIRDLKWSDISRGFIRISPTNSKTGKRRLVPVSDNLAKWLASYQKAKGFVWEKRQTEKGKQFTPATLDKEVNLGFRTAAKSARLKWRHNALRHSYISYRLAHIQDAAKVALEAGNSPSIIFAHYRELVAPDDAKTWFALEPKKAKNVVAMVA